MDVLAKLTSLMTGSPPVENAAKALSKPKAEPAHPAPSIGTGAVSNSQPKRQAPDLNHLPHCSDRTIAAIAAMCGFKVPQSTRDKIAEAQKGYDNAFRAMCDLADGGARKMFAKQQSELQEMVRQGKDISGIDLWDLDELEKEARQKLLFYKQTMRHFSEAALELVRPHIAEFVTAANALADRLDAEHQQTCAVLCLHEVPSYPAMMCRKAAWQVGKRADNAGTDSPSAICSFIPS